MRVGIITYGLDRAETGIGRATRELVEALARLQPGPDLYPLTPYSEGTFRKDGWRSYHLAGCRRLPALMTLGNLGVVAAARSLSLDIAHDPTSVGPFLLRWGWNDCKRVITIHDLIPYIYPQSHTALNNFLYRCWLPLVVKNVHAIIVPSHATKQDVIRYLKVDPQAVHVVYWGLDRQFQPVADRTHALAVLGTYNVAPPYLLYIGGIEHRKNLTGLLKAFSKVKKSLPGYRLVIVGKKNWKYEHIFTLVGELGLDADVVFTGYVPDSHLPCLYSLAEAFVFPSLYEGFGFPPLEAMACGTPVITSNTSSLPEVCGDAPRYVNPLDTESLASAIQSAALDRGQREAMIARGLAHAERFRWQRTAEATMAVYEELLTGREQGSPGSRGE